MQVSDVTIASGVVPIERQLAPLEQVELIPHQETQMAKTIG